MTNYLDEKNAHYVIKDDNLACVPELQPIEDFWAILKNYVYENNREAENKDQMQNGIFSCFRKVNKNLVQRMCAHVHRKVEAAHCNGEKALFHSCK